MSGDITLTVKDFIQLGFYLLVLAGVYFSLEKRVTLVEKDNDTNRINNAEKFTEAYKEILLNRSTIERVRETTETKAEAFERRLEEKLEQFNVKLDNLYKLILESKNQK